MYYKEGYVSNKGSLRRGSTKHVFFMLATGCPEIKLVLGVLLAPKIASQLVEYIQGWTIKGSEWRPKKSPFDPKYTYRSLECFSKANSIFGTPFAKPTHNLQILLDE